MIIIHRYYTVAVKFGPRYTSKWDYELLNAMNSAVTLSATWGQYCHWLIEMVLLGGKWTVVKKGQVFLTIRSFIYLFIFYSSKQWLYTPSARVSENSCLQCFLYTFLYCMHIACVSRVCSLLLCLSFHLWSPCPSLWVGNVTTELTEKHLWDLFKK